MEGLVNYSSDEEQDDYGAQTVAARRSPTTRNNDYYSTTLSRGHGTANNGHSNYKNEDFKNRNKAVSSTYSSNRGGSPHSSRDIGRDNYRNNGRDNRAESPYTSRDASRDNRTDSPSSRDGGRDNRYKYERQNERNHFKDHYKNEQKHCNRRNVRADERSYNNSSSHQNERQNNNSRTERSRYGESSRRHHSHHYDKSPRRSERTERSEYHKHRRDTNKHRSGYSDEKSRYRKRNSRSRSHSRSASPARRSNSKDRSVHPLEQARLSALEMERKLNVEDIDTEKSRANYTRHSEALLSLPLSNNASKQPNIIAVASSTATSNSAEPAVIQLPSYYNPSVINPNKYAEQVQKRKLLWGAKKSEDTASKWGNAQFSQDSDGKVASKFMRLMGIKNSAAPNSSNAEVEKKVTPPPDVKSREDMFTSMEKQYEVARQVTHTMRGVGLGFSSQPRQF